MSWDHLNKKSEDYTIRKIFDDKGNQIGAECKFSRSFLRMRNKFYNPRTNRYEERKVTYA